MVSRKNGEGRYLRAAGYLAGKNFEPVHDDDVPDDFKMHQPGVALWVLRSFENDWEKAVCASVVSHYFHAIIHVGLEAEVNGTRVTADNLEDFLDKDKDSIRNFINVSRKKPIASTEIEGIGKINLRLEVHKDSNPRKQREIALIRDAGMMITDDRRSMGLSRIKNIPSQWHGFTAIVECLSEGELSLLRDSETPKHNEISIEEISDEGRRIDAKNQLYKLGHWIREILENHTAPPEVENEENASELARYLPIEAPDGSGERLTISAISQRNTPPPSRRGIKRVPGSGAMVTDSSGNEDDGGASNGKGKGNRRRRPRPVGSSRRNVQMAFGNIRFQSEADGASHVLKVSFDNSGEKIDGVGLMAVMEDGQERNVKIRRAKYRNGKSIGIDRKTGAMKSIQESAERISVELHVIEPVAGKTFTLKEVKI